MNGFFIALWLISRPFIWTYTFARWFIVSVAKETSGNLVKIIGGLIAVGIISHFLQFFVR